MKYFFFILLVPLIINSSCKKNGAGTTALLQQYFETNVLNRNFTVTLAQDSITDFTPGYNGYVFVLLKADYYQGPLTATKNGIVYNGTWSSNDDYSRLDITLLTPPEEFGFLSRAWRFTSKSFPTMKLAPWGSNANLVLNMYRQ